jgi:hypothetical protein
LALQVGGHEAGSPAIVEWEIKKVETTDRHLLDYGTKNKDYEI